MPIAFVSRCACYTVFNILSVQVKSFSSIIIVLKLNFSPSIFSPGESSTWMSMPNAGGNFLSCFPLILYRDTVD